MSRGEIMRVLSDFSRRWRSREILCVRNYPPEKVHADKADPAWRSSRNGPANLLHKLEWRLYF
jgi:hypothetical protein